MTVFECSEHGELWWALYLSQIPSLIQMLKGRSVSITLIIIFQPASSGKPFKTLNFSQFIPTIGFEILKCYGKVLAQPCKGLIACLCWWFLSKNNYLKCIYGDFVCSGIPWLVMMEELFLPFQDGAQTLSLHPIPPKHSRVPMHGEYLCYITFNCLAAGLLQDLVCKKQWQHKTWHGSLKTAHCPISPVPS